MHLGSRILYIKGRDESVYTGFVVIPVAKDIDEKTLEKYANRGYTCLFEAEDGFEEGELKSDDGFLYLEYETIEGTVIRRYIPDDTYFIMLDKTGRVMKSCTGVTSFPSEDDLS